MPMGKGMRMYLMAGGGGNRSESAENRNEMRGSQGGGSRNEMAAGYSEMRGGQGAGSRNEMVAGYSEMRGGRGGGNQNEMAAGYSEMRGGRGGGNQNEMAAGYSEMREGEGGGNRNEMRDGGRIGDPRSEYGAEGVSARYRGKDGRYHAGTRRSEYDGDQMRMGGDEEGTYEVTIAPKNNMYPMVWPYAPRDTNEEERYANYGNDAGVTDRKIGFGASMNMESQSMQKNTHKGKAEAKMHHGMDEQTAREWVDSMESTDKAHPKGGKWEPEQLEALAKKHGVPTTGKEWWEFYAMVNAMYSDYSEVAKRYNITSPDFYAQMALAFINDRDAVDDKVMKYWEYIAK